MCGLVVALWVLMCVGGPAYLMWQLGHPYQALLMLVLSSVLVTCAWKLGGPITPNTR